MNAIIGAHPTFTTTDQRHGLLDRTVHHDGNEYIYVQASGAIDQYDAVAIDEDGQATAMTHTLGGTGQRVGWAQVAFADNEYGWVGISGTLTGNVAGSCAADATLYTNTTTGYLDDASQANSIKVNGVVATTAVNTAGSTEIIVHSAHLET